MQFPLTALILLFAAAVFFWAQVAFPARKFDGVFAIFGALCAAAGFVVAMIEGVALQQLAAAAMTLAVAVLLLQSLSRKEGD